MTTIHFVRHGQVEDPDNIFYGRLPGYPLSDDGIACINYTGRQLRKFPVSAIYHSPLLRTTQSAKILADILNVSITADERIIELGTLFEGKSRDYLLQYPPTSSEFSETMEDIYARMADFLRDIAKKHEGQHIVAVSHGGPIRLLEMGLLDQPFTDYGYSLEAVPVCGSDTVITCDGQNFKVNRTEL